MTELDRTGSIVVVANVLHATQILREMHVDPHTVLASQCHHLQEQLLTRAAGRARTEPDTHSAVARTAPLPMHFHGSVDTGPSVLDHSRMHLGRTARVGRNVHYTFGNPGTDTRLHHGFGDTIEAVVTRQKGF